MIAKSLKSDLNEIFCKGTQKISKPLYENFISNKGKYFEMYKSLKQEFIAHYNHSSWKFWTVEVVW